MMMKKVLFLMIGWVLAACPAFSQTRLVRTINDWWTFTKEGQTTLVNIPHTWNADDTWDDEPGYYRGLCTYTKTVEIPEDLSDKNVYVRFEAAYQDATVLVNGNLAGRHLGGTTAFCFDITPFVRQGENRFEVRLDNANNPAIPPLAADYTFFGGIYRDVELIFTPKVQISTTHYATSGVYVTTPSVSEKESRVEVLTYMTNATSSACNLLLEQKVTDPSGVVVASVRTKVRVPASTVNFPARSSLTLQNCALWDIESPSLYRLETSVQDAKGKTVLDAVENRFGLRTFRFDADKGFFLNGRHVKLMGTNRHQDQARIGYALTDEMHVRDIRLLKEMGSNFLRIAHYPQDPVITQLCDRLGIVATVEIPVIDYITCDNQAFIDNCLNMATEMVYQDFNSPSVVVWAFMNEILNHQEAWFKRSDPVEKKIPYWKQVEGIAQQINARIKSLDAFRPTMIPCNASVSDYGHSGIAAIPDILGWNLYKGWYGSDFNGAVRFLNEAREAFPGKPVIITEYGAGVDPRIHSSNPVLFDFSQEYGVRFHQYYINLIRSREWIAGSNVWNFNDFYVERRIDAVAHVNNKGLVGLDRKPKDTYLLYKAALSGKPALFIGGKDWALRGGDEGVPQNVYVFTNADEVTLFLNGERLGAYPVKDYLAQAPVVFRDGDNRLCAEASKDGQLLRDVLDVRFRAIPKEMDRFLEMNVMLGSDRCFCDDVAGAVWIPDREYTPGRWGYIGGKSGVFPKYNAPASSLDIFGTQNNPIFQTWREGIASFRADVPDGQYYVYLYLAELNPKADRRFSVSINGQTCLHDVELRRNPGPQKALIQKFTVPVTGGTGLSVDFLPGKGEPVLNAIRIYRCF